MLFGVMLSTLVGLMHWYIWKRLVKDTIRPGRARRVLGVVTVLLALLVAATLVLPRTIGLRGAGWYAWPGYIWFGLLVYLFLTLAVLELPRLALRGWVRRAEVDSGQRPGTSTVDAQRIAELEREVKELRRANEVLKAASAFFARELDPRPPR